ncbi:protein RETARDED ROOT GROWTH-LIKE-like [Apium graveolens]|uniref:protein RETARDED ROOT GROWTH-LIKE-like n=1 Tax=Apium graveolens TaxID=4045 RepID=UPI003D7AD510
MATKLPLKLKSLRLFSLSSPSSPSLLRSLFTLSNPTGPIFRPPTMPSPSSPLNTGSFSLFLPQFRAVIVSGAGGFYSPVRFMSSVTETVESNDGGVVDEDAKTSIPVRAYFFSTSVDLKRLIEVNKPNFIPPTSRMTNYVVLRFGDLNSELKGSDSSLCGSDCSYIVVFQYGSIVLFNVPDNEIDGYLSLVKTHASGILPEMRKDEYEVREKPTLDTWMQGGLDYIMLQYLNIDGIRTVGSVLGQSIALDYYVRQVDLMVAEFTDINRGMEKSGTFAMEKKKLFQLVGKANSNLADVILKLGLFERSDIAWKDAKYAEIWEYLRDEFELTQRFASLDFKLKFVEHNIRFLQESLQNRKSDSLEWLIIVLIGTEILISIYDIAQKSVL